MPRAVSLCSVLNSGSFLHRRLDEAGVLGGWVARGSEMFFSLWSARSGSYDGIFADRSSARIYVCPQQRI